jgi:hypothetical protein
LAEKLKIIDGWMDGLIDGWGWGWGSLRLSWGAWEWLGHSGSGWGFLGRREGLKGECTRREGRGREMRQIVGARDESQWIVRNLTLARTIPCPKLGRLRKICVGDNSKLLFRV